MVSSVSAVSPEGPPSPVDVSCRKYTPDAYRTSVACFEKDHKKEVYLSCAFYGVINILYAEHGYEPDVEASSSCHATRTRTCRVNALDEDSIKQACMGQASCVLTVSRRTIPSCAVDSNYFQVEYQCVQGTYGDCFQVEYQCVQGT